MNDGAGAKPRHRPPRRLWSESMADLESLRPEQLGQRLVHSQDLLERFSRSAGVRFSRAIVLTDACRYREALAQLNKAERLLGREHSFIHELRGEVYLARGDFVRAEKALRRALPDSPDPAPYLSLARALLFREHVASGLQVLRRAWRRWGQSQDGDLVAEQLALFWTRQQRPGVARVWLRQVPGAEPARIPDDPFENRLVRLKFREALRMAAGLPAMLAELDRRRRRHRSACRGWAALESTLGAAAWILAGSAAARAGDLKLAESLQRRAIDLGDAELLNEAWLNLALVLRAQGRIPDLQVASFDHRVRDNARALGFVVVPQGTAWVRA